MSEREPYKRHISGDKECDSMNLPDGKTCGDCIHCPRCQAMFGHIPDDERCDFYPSRFFAASPVKGVTA